MTDTVKEPPTLGERVGDRVFVYNTAKTLLKEGGMTYGPADVLVLADWLLAEKIVILTEIDTDDDDDDGSE